MEEEIDRSDNQAITLLLLYLNAWDENEDYEDAPPLLRSWKNLETDDLDALDAAGLIRNKKGAQSVFLTEAGRQRARVLLSELLGKQGRF